MPPKASFVVGEKLLCYHGPLLYEAKCLNVETKDKKQRYLVHYSGWKKHWDEWVPEDRILKYNDANLQKQEELKKLHIKCKKASKKETPAKKEVTKKPEASIVQNKSPKPKPPEKKIQKVQLECQDTKASTSEQKHFPKTEPKQPAKTELRQVSKIEQNRLYEAELKQLDKLKLKKIPKSYKPSRQLIEKEEENLHKSIRKKNEPKHMHIKESQTEKGKEILIPKQLEDLILYDHNLVKNQNKIVTLPARLTVEQMLANYVKDKESDEISESEKKNIIEFAKYTQNCFDVLLPKICLYKFEEAQYEEIHKNELNKSNSAIYGGIHLLRFLCLLDDLLKEYNPPGPELNKTINDVNNFIKYLAVNLQFFKRRDYEDPPAGYADLK